MSLVTEYRGLKQEGIARYVRQEEFNVRKSSYKEEKKKEAEI